MRPSLSPVYLYSCSRHLEKDYLLCQTTHERTVPLSFSFSLFLLHHLDRCLLRAPDSPSNSKEEKRSRRRRINDTRQDPRRQTAMTPSWLLFVPVLFFSFLPTSTLASFTCFIDHSSLGDEKFNNNKKIEGGNNNKWLRHIHLRNNHFNNVPSARVPISHIVDWLPG
jgi:hypothetical protein